MGSSFRGLCGVAVMEAARPIDPRDRSEFLRDVAAALEKYEEIGPGIVGRVVREMQRRHFDPPEFHGNGGGGKFADGPSLFVEQGNSRHIGGESHYDRCDQSQVFYHRRKTGLDQSSLFDYAVCRRVNQHRQRAICLSLIISRFYNRIVESDALNRDP